MQPTAKKCTRDTEAQTNLNFTRAMLDLLQMESFALDWKFTWLYAVLIACDLQEHRVRQSGYLP